MATSTFRYGKEKLTADGVLKIASGQIKGVIDAETKKRIQANHQHIRNIVKSNKPLYGVNTGFGPLCTTRISESETQKLQDNLLKSHSVGVGEPISGELAMMMLILKLHSLCRGFSGVSFALLERIMWHIENKVIPVVPSQGSVGASGDLAPLAHLFLPLIGLGKVFQNGIPAETGKVLQRHKLKPLVLGPKEGLALINGTQFIAAHGVKAVERLHNCLEHADIIGAMTLEALQGSSRPFIKELHELRPFAGSIHVAERLSVLLAGSEILQSHADCDRVQDPYSLRCMPQVHGASRNAWLHLKEMVTCEINSVTDNPIVLDEENTISGGNFHGQLLAIPLDYAAVAASELGNISDRRIYLLLEGKAGLPTLLMKNTGINSGFMIPQYTSAALVSENKSLCFPASADSIPTSLGQEDHVSMGSISGRKVNQIIDNLEKILAIELVSAAQAFDYRRPLKSGKILEACHNMVRKHISHTEVDRIFSEDIETARQLIVSGKLIVAAAQVAGKEKMNLKGKNYELFNLS